MNVGDVPLEAVEVRVVRLPLVRPFATAHGTTTERNVLLVRARGAGVEGWGECAAAAAPDYWYETVATARDALPRLVAGEPVVGHPMARVALEMACLDLQLRVAGRSLRDELGATRASVTATATVGFEDDVEAFVAAGYRSVKVKVSPGRALPRPVHGVAFQADANGSFAGAEPSALDALGALDELGLVCLEQPLAPDDLAGHANLRRHLRTPVCLDESIASTRDVDAALALDAVDIVNVKASRLGGLRNAAAVVERCAAAGIGTKVGGMLETGIGRAAALALAALPGCTLPPDLAASDRYYVADLTAPFTLQGDGTLAVPTGPGLGVEVDVAAVERATIVRSVIPVART